MEERKEYESKLAVATTSYRAAVELRDHASAQLCAETMAQCHHRLALLDEQERKLREEKIVV